MVVDYSKFDSIEVSDDSDIEVHPNVDKKSFIRAKQNQIHQQRQQRRHEIETLKYERIVNDGLLERINALLDALRKHQDDSRNPDELVFQALIESAGDPAKDEAPKPPEGVYAQQKEGVPRFSKMMGSLVDQVKKDVDEKKDPNRLQSFIEGIRTHLTKVQDLQQELLKKLSSLEKEEGSKITSDSIRTGFSSSSITKTKDFPNAPKTKEVELLNPSPSSRPKLPNDSIASGAEADVEDAAPNDDDINEADLQPTALGKQFAKIKLGDYRASLQFISSHPEIVSERETDGLLVEAFNAQMDGRDAYARLCVHQGLLLQYCGKLGRDGVGLFFKRITTKDHRAGKVFMDDVNTTYTRIKMRSMELLKEKPDPAGVEQIQLHAVDPSTTIHITTPAADSQDPVEMEKRKIFESFPPNLRKALEASSLDRVNEVLGKMSVEEAEEVVRLLGEGDMLSLEEGVLDATTEEGQKRLKEIEEEGKVKGQLEPGAVGDGDGEAGPALQEGSGVEGFAIEAKEDEKPGDPE